MSLSEKKCVPCEGMTDPLSNSEEDNYLQMVSGWKLNREGEHNITKDYKLKDFVEAISFVNKIAEIAESEGHHPNILIKYNLVGIELYTHAIGGLSVNDFILATKIDEVF
jgi:4a-hydroxytetrahydrobiopterin dehydratase